MTVGTYSSLENDVIAGRNASVSAAGPIQGNVIVGVNAELFTADLLAGNVTTTTGDISVEAWGSVQSMLDSGHDISVFAGSGGTLTSTSAAATSIISIGGLQAFVTSGTSTEILATGIFTGAIDAGTNANLIGFTGVSSLVHALGNALIFAGTSQQGSVTAGLSAAIVSLGTISGSQITAGESALAYAVGSITTVNVTGDAAALITWEGAGGPSMVQGISSAYAFAYAEFDGVISASNGSAALVAIGNVPSTTSISASEDAIAVTAGSFGGSLSAGEFGGVISLLGFSGSVNAGADGLVLSEGQWTGSLTAGQDAFGWNLTDVSGTISAGRDAALVSFGAFTGAVSAGRDVLGIATLGDLSGTVSAARNVGDLLTYSAFSANVSATNAVNEVDQGQIGNVTSVGAMTGSLTAAHSIGNVTSSDAITTAIAAPSVGSVLPFNTSYFSSLVTPTAPASIRGDVLAEAATSRAAVQADRADFVTSSQLFVSETQQDGQDLQVEIAQSRTDGLTALADDSAAILVQVAADVATDEQEAQSGLTEDRADATTDYLAIVADTATQGQAQADSWAAADVASIEDFDAAVVDAQAARQRAIDKRQEATDEKTAATTRADELRILDQNWESRVPTVWGTLNNAINPCVMIPNLIEHIQQTNAQLTQLVDAAGYQGWQRDYTVWGATLADLVGLRAIEGAFSGSDPFTLEPWSDGYRLFQFVTGTLQLAGTAFTISSVVSYCVSPCGSLSWGKCFVGDTQVLTREIEPATVVATASAEDSCSDTFEFLTPVCILVGVGGVLALQRKRRKLRNPGQHVMTKRTIDQLFAKANERFFWNPEESGLRRVTCDLFDDSDSTCDLECPAPQTQSVRELEPEFPIGPNPTAWSFTPNRSLATQSPSVMEFKPLSKLSAPALTYPHDDAPQFQTWRDPKPIESPPDPTDHWRPTSIAWLMLWLLLGGLCFLQSKPTSWATPTIAKDSADQETTIKQFESKPIQDIRTGMRVVANNPELQGQEIPDTKIAPHTWRNVHLRMTKPDGGELLITLLRSMDWLGEHHAELSREIRLTFPELGIDGQAQVLRIESCPPIKSGPGRVVTGTFRHSAANIIDLYVSCEDQPIGTTANHPFWSETRQDFVQAGMLRAGERLLANTEVPTFVNRIVLRDRAHAVYNLEVDQAHTYTVASNGLLVHNSGDGYGNLPKITAQEAAENGLNIRDPNWPWRGMHEIESHHPLMQGSSYRQFWKDRGFSNTDVESFRVDLDADVHQAFTNSGWWDNKLFENIHEAEALLNGTRLLNKDEVLTIVDDLLGEVAIWSP